MKGNVLHAASVAVVLAAFSAHPALANGLPTQSPSALPSSMTQDGYGLADSLSGGQTAKLTEAERAEINKSVADSPDPHKLPILKSILEQPDTDIYPLGHMQGLDGWFTANKQNQVEIFYTTAGGVAMFVGEMFNSEGDNVTEEQLVALRDRDPVVGKLFKKAAQNVEADYRKRTFGSLPDNKVDPFSAGEQLIKELQVASWVSVGNDKAPILYMVIDPHCEHCKNAWKALADYVKNGKVQVRLVPVDILGDDSRRLAADLIATSDPAAMWQKMVAGDLASIKDTPTADALQKISINHDIFYRWKMPATPYFVYRAQDQKIKIILGEPDDPAKVVSDLYLVP